jgi:hypothetical protein
MTQIAEIFSSTFGFSKANARYQIRKQILELLFFYSKRGLVIVENYEFSPHFLDHLMHDRLKEGFIVGLLWFFLPNLLF